MLSFTDIERRLIIIGVLTNCIFFSLRVLYTETFFFLFLFWNLFLAFIPWVISLNIKAKSKGWKQILLFVFWLLFFPNSLYIITDIFHITLKSSTPIWFDLVFILSFAWTGLVLGFSSLIRIENWLQYYSKYSQIISYFILLLASFGIYLGRYERWNSWDIIHQPKALVMDVINRFIQPIDHPRTWAMTISYAILLACFWYSIKVVGNQINSVKK